jgi:hypothetical protein
MEKATGTEKVTVAVVEVVRSGGGGMLGGGQPYMGGVSYQLPGFTGIAYQPKDYTAELDRIINESLFKGMI